MMDLMILFQKINFKDEKKATYNRVNFTKLYLFCLNMHSFRRKFMNTTQVSSFLSGEFLCGWLIN